MGGLFSTQAFEGAIREVFDHRFQQPNTVFANQRMFVPPGWFVAGRQHAMLSNLFNRLNLCCGEFRLVAAHATGGNGCSNSSVRARFRGENTQEMG